MELFISNAAYRVTYSLTIAFAQDSIAETFTAWTWFFTDFCSLSEGREGEEQLD